MINAGLIRQFANGMQLNSQATDAGRYVAGDYAPPPTTDFPEISE